MVQRNSYFEKLSTNYLFAEIGRRVRTFQALNPQAPLVRLSIGDTTEPLPFSIYKGMQDCSVALGTREGYRGYGPEQGEDSLRGAICSHFYPFFSPEEIFISDGAKCDLARLLVLFGPGRKIALQNPTYPAFVDAARLMGSSLIELPCTPENGFFPHLEDSIPPFDLLYFCSPNNPTGAAATFSELSSLLFFVKKRKAILLFDAAYANFIRSDSLPRSIYEIPGAREFAIEINSFSKLAGFTGVRLGWTVVPHDLTYQDGRSVREDWNRICTTLFNGASSISQAGGVAALSTNGRKEIAELSGFYMENADILKKALLKRGYKTYGGENAPYLWLRGEGRSSWDLFTDFLENRHIVTTPGSGFGEKGEGFLRLSAFGQRETILEATRRL